MNTPSSLSTEQLNSMMSAEIIENINLGEGEGLDSIREKTSAVVGDLGLVALWFDEASIASSQFLTKENEVFPEINDLIGNWDHDPKFLAIVEPEADDGAFFRHGFRVCFSDRDRAPGDPTKLALIDELIDSDQGLTVEMLELYYESIGMNINNMMSVETNFKFAGKSIVSELGVPVSNLGYLELFRKAREGGVDMIFAHQNARAIKSLGRLGVKTEHIGGVSNLRSPGLRTEEGQMTYVDNHTPLSIPSSEHNMQVFAELDIVDLPSITL